MFYMVLSTLWTTGSLLFSAYASPSSRPIHGGQAVNLWRLSKLQEQKLQHLESFDSQQAVLSHTRSKSLKEEFPEQWFEQPLDHFSDSSHTFNQRYWVNKRHYKKGGPVIVLDGGETSGEDRLPFLDTGIVEILANATNGLGVVLEHRYYGGSIAVANLSTDSLRFLNNAQSAADSANFMANVKFEGIDNDLTSPRTPWIYYGGSYAGARAAHMKILYPDLVYGAIASSGVTHATLENWEYDEIIRRAADPECSRHLETAIDAIDAILLNAPHLSKPLKAVFGLADLEHDDDFASLIESPLGAWQSKNWDPEVGSTRFDEFCETLAKPLIGKAAAELIALPGGLEIPITVYNYGKYIREHYVSRCPEGVSVEDCFGSHDDEKFLDDSLSDTWRLWLFQVCTEWGYFQAYPPGKHFVVPSLPNITVVNELGDFSIAADRLAIIDGEVDPWRPDTPHAYQAPNREDTILRPFKLIPNGVHHYDEYGLRNIEDEPPEIIKIHKEMIHFVKEWLNDWDNARTGNGTP